MQKTCTSILAGNIYQPDCDLFRGHNFIKTVCNNNAVFSDFATTL